VRAWISLVLLSLVVAGLGAWMYYKPAHDAEETYALSALKLGDVKRVRLERMAPARSAKPDLPPAEPLSLEKADGAWRITSPFAARADAFQVERLLSILNARSNVRYSPTDLARYGLDRPQASLTVDDQSFTYGAINATTREQYVMTGNAVYLVPLAYSATLPRSADTMLARSLFGTDEKPTRFDLPDFTVSMEDGTWAVAPAMADIGPDERNAWVDAWQQASAIDVKRHGGAHAAEEIKVHLKDGRTIVLGIVQRAPELVLVRQDEGVEYHFVAAVARRLLAPPGASNVTK
jgi:hypothetical protein